jgi:hypothetical protein
MVKAINFDAKKEQIEFVKELGAILDKYHAGIYLIDRVFEGACMIVEAIELEQKK